MPHRQTVTSLTRVAILLALAGESTLAQPPRRTTARDSFSFVTRARAAEAAFTVAWRKARWPRSDKMLEMTPRDTPRPMVTQPAPLNPRTAAESLLGQPLLANGFPPPRNRCNAQSSIRYDIDQHDWGAHLVVAPHRNYLSFCPEWIRPSVNRGRSGQAPPDQRLAMDAAIPQPAKPAIAQQRYKLLLLLDSAARAIPGDPWIAGQAIRFYVDQGQPDEAVRIASQCKAEAWWCAALKGFALVSAGMPSADAAFEQMRAAMPAAVRCEWDNGAILFPYTGRTAYSALSCAQQESVNARLWWLADPLYTQPGNARRTEHYARRVLIEIHAASVDDIDEYTDWREGYEGPAMREMLLRYGWPTQMTGRGSNLSDGKFDIQSVYRGTAPKALYWGPQYHTVPNWRAMTDPFSATDADWELGPDILSAQFWDTSWWAPEFYRREAGALVGLLTQTAFFRRQSSAMVAVGAQWDTTTFIAPAARAVLGVTATTGPDDPMTITRGTVDAGTPWAGLLAPVPSRPALLAVEVMPSGGMGPSARTRFGVTPPPPLSALAPGELAVSDPALVRTGAAESVPASMQEMLARIYGSTQLLNPQRLAVFWEVYGLATGDTVDVAVRVIRKNDANIVTRAVTAATGGTILDDTLVVTWREPRQGDPGAVVDGNVTIRPRNVVLDVSRLMAANYTLEISVNRPGGAAVTRRQRFAIVRR